MSRSRLALRAELVVLFLGVFLCAQTQAVSAADPKESKDAVKITATADKPDANGNQTLTITLDINPRWHLYANPVKNEDMLNSQTVVKIGAQGKLDDLKITYPAGKTKKDPIGNYDIYEGKVDVKATVRRAKDDTSPLEVSVQVSACDESKCLLPSTVKIKVEPK